MSGVFERQGDEWVEREPDYGHVPPTTFHEGTGELHSAFTGPPVSFIPLPGRIGLPLQPSGYQRWAGRAPTRPAAQRPAARVRPELAALAAPPPTPSAEQRAFEHFLANLTWQCERCSTPVTPDTMRVPEPVAGAFHLYCQGCA